MTGLRNIRGFLSDYYLGNVLGRGDSKRRVASDREALSAQQRLRRIRDRAEGRCPDAGACRERLVRPLLRDVLSFHLGAGADRLHGLYLSAVSEARGERPLALAYCGSWDEELDGDRGAAARRTGDALAAHGLRYGLLVTGERVRLMRATGDGPRGACLEADLSLLAEDADASSVAAFLRLFGSSAFAPDSAGAVAFDEIERESRRHAQQVSESLKTAVFSAAESLMRGLVDDAVARGIGRSAVDLSREQILSLREAALTALYRILFVLYAEARDPRLDEHRLYRESYSAHGLLDEILRDPVRGWPRNRCGLWERLRALFWIYDRGLPSIEPWRNIPPRGGLFFSRDTAQGRLLDEARLSDATVAQLMLDLATTQGRAGVGRERISFRELDIESLGAVYEGLLEFEPRIAEQTTLEIRAQGRLYALNPADVVRLCDQKKLCLQGDTALTAGTAAESLRLVGSGSSDAQAPEEEEEEEHEEEGEDGGIRKGAAATVVRRLEPGEFHFVPGAGRKGSGSFYTPLALVQDLVAHALTPLVDGKTAAEIEAVRILDPACGSAHFLVEAMRFLGRGLHRAYVRELGGRPPGDYRSTTGQGWDDAWQATDQEARSAGSESRAWCKRRVAERCLFGVDLNPMAVQLAHVALWVESVAGDRPLTYFEHHVRCGNSLAGTWTDALERPPLPSMDRSDAPDQIGMFEDFVRSGLHEAAELRRLIAGGSRAALAREGVEPESVDEQELKEQLRQQAARAIGAARLLFDLRSASAYVPSIWREWGTLCGLMGTPGELEAYAARRPWWREFEVVRERERFFHWEIEFPEVFFGENPGFDAVLGNPPWDKVLPARKEFYGGYDVLVRALSGADLDRRIRELHGLHRGLAEEFAEYQQRTKTAAGLLRKGGDFAHAKARSGSAHEDLSKYFVDRAARLTRQDGRVGMIVPSVIYNGDGSVGLRRFLLREATIERFYGFENRKKIFPIHSSYKFVSLVFRKSDGGARGFEAAFMRHDLDELAATAAGRERAPWIVRLSRQEIERLSPETAAFLEYRGPDDQRMVAAMHEGRPTLGGDGRGAWGARLISWRQHEAVYNATEDRDLWTDPKGRRLYAPDWVLGSQHRGFGDVLERMRERGLWPVFEGKHIEQFLVGIKPVRWWLSVEQAERKYGKPPRSEPTLVFRETASNTNERTCIAAVLPAFSVGAHTLTGVVASAVTPSVVATALNSFVFDWAMRLRTAGTHVSFTYILPMPVPPAEVVRGLPRIATRLAWETGAKHITDLEELWPDLWASNRAMAEAYGLGPDDLRRALESFPVFARKRPRFYAYLLERLAEWGGPS